MKHTNYLFISALLLLSISTAHAFQGKVVGVSDGDTITVMNKGIGEKICLYGVDCPEKAQDFQNSKNLEGNK